QELVDEYLRWLREGLSASVVSDACELTTPFLDRHNDHLQLYAKRSDGKVTLTDDGYIYSDLLASGLEFNTPKRKAALDTTLHGFGVRLDERNHLVVEATTRNLGQKVHSLIQAMVGVNDMFLLAQSRVASFFFEDVRSFLDAHEIRYIDRVKISGTSGFDHAIDFLIPKSASRPERLLQTINVPTKSTVTSYLFTLTDTRDARGADSEAYVFLNDEDQTVSGGTIEALEAYNVTPARWTRRDEFVEALAS
ncbi:MAG: DUF1828 domain-containing protein, partial [Actinomycetota bacterium]